MEPERESTVVDRTGSAFWEGWWASKSRSRVVGSPRLRHWEVPQAAFFDRAFARLGETRGKRLIEVGAGDSGWLPYFAKRWGFDVSGLDYSPIGCQRATDLAQSAGVNLHMVLGDLFAPPPELCGTFDVAFSNGVVEHYEDTPRTLAALGRLLRPGGLLITIVPNIPGVLGWLFRHFNRPVYLVHVPIDAARMREAHERAGLEVLECGYLMSVNLGVVNLVGLDPSKLATRVKSVAIMGMIGFSRAVWACERVFGELPAHPSVSPYVAAVARKL